MPVTVVPEAAVPVAAVPDRATPVTPMPGGAMPTRAVALDAERIQEMVVHLALQQRARLARTGMPGQPTDISVGMAMTMTMPTEAMPVITDTMCSHVPVLSEGDSGNVSLRQKMRATTSTGSMIKMSWTSKVHQVRHVLVHGS